jgi:hypothetical protein
VLDGNCTRCPALQQNAGHDGHSAAMIHQQKDHKSVDSGKEKRPGKHRRCGPNSSFPLPAEKLRPIECHSEEEGAACFRSYETLPTTILSSWPSCRQSLIPTRDTVVKRRRTNDLRNRIGRQPNQKRNTESDRVALVICQRTQCQSKFRDRFINTQRCSAISSNVPAI